MFFIFDGRKHHVVKNCSVWSWQLRLKPRNLSTCIDIPKVNHLSASLHELWWAGSRLSLHDVLSEWSVVGFYAPRISALLILFRVSMPISARTHMSTLFCDVGDRQALTLSAINFITAIRHLCSFSRVLQVSFLLQTFKIKTGLGMVWPCAKMQIGKSWCAGMMRGGDIWALAIWLTSPWHLGKPLVCGTRIGWCRYLNANLLGIIGASPRKFTQKEHFTHNKEEGRFFGRSWQRRTNLIQTHTHLLHD